MPICSERKLKNFDLIHEYVSWCLDIKFKTNLMHIFIVYFYKCIFKIFEKFDCILYKNCF